MHGSWVSPRPEPQLIPQMSSLREIPLSRVTDSVLRFSWPGFHRRAGDWTHAGVRRETELWAGYRF